MLNITPCSKKNIEILTIKFILSVAFVINLKCFNRCVFYRDFQTDNIFQSFTDWSLSIRWFNVISRILVAWILSLGRDATGLMLYRLGNTALWIFFYIYIYIYIYMNFDRNEIPTIHQKSFKSLGRCYSLPLTNQHCWQDLSKLLKDGFC